MDVGSLFFSFRGRINRAKYWLAILVYIIINVIVSVLGLAIGHGVAMQGLSAIVGIALFISGLAVGAKRLHDRNKSAWWLLLFYVVPGVLVVVAVVLGLVGVGAGSSSAGIIAILIYIISLAIIVWAFVELGCLRGTIGANQYGPDPLPPGP
jgi:uncharacterized membrane protein YhaH (DUF805 family)